MELSAQKDGYITIDRVSVKFGDHQALKDISFSIKEGMLFGLVGSDGAGKSTLLRAMATMIRPTEGRITVGGFDTGKNRKQAKSLIGYMPQRFGLYPDLTVKENIEFFMDIFAVRGRTRKERMERYLGFSGLLPFTDRRAADLSGGMKQKLGLACVLVHQPRVLILDEPTNGVDPLSRREFWRILTEMQRGEGMTIVVSTSYLDEGDACDGLALMHRSALIETGPPLQLRRGFADLEEAVVNRLTQVDEELIHDSFRR